jgi:hypothetical protein
MKKSLTLLALVLGMSGAFAQDLTSKKGEPFLPEAGDWGLGIDANPFLEYAGNFFGNHRKVFQRCHHRLPWFIENWVWNCD